MDTVSSAVLESIVSRLSQVIRVLIVALIVETFAIVGVVALLTSGEDYTTETTETVEQTAADSGANTYVGGDYGEAEDYQDDQND
jgi:hypothetical protein